MILVGFTFYNELDMLELHLGELYEQVDKFIIVESTVTHRNHPKPLYYADKIVHVVVDDMPGGEDPWVRERYQRDAIKRGVESVPGVCDDDILIICDVDEVVSSSTIEPMARLFADNPTLPAVRIGMILFYYNFLTACSAPWYHCISVRVNLLNSIGCSDLRCDSGGGTGDHGRGCKYIHGGGWHMSYFGNVEFIRNKLLNFAHSEFSGKEYTDIERIQAAINSNNDLFARGRVCSFSKVNYPLERRPKLWRLVAEE